MTELVLWVSGMMLFGSYPLFRYNTVATLFYLSIGFATLELRAANKVKIIAHSGWRCSILGVR